MGNPRRAKGTRFERLIVDYLGDELPHEVERRVQGGSQDRGDIAGVPGWAIECKNHRKMTLAKWVDEAATEAANAEVDHYAVVHKRRGKGHARDQYVTMPMSVFVRLLHDI